MEAAALPTPSDCEDGGSRTRALPPVTISVIEVISLAFATGHVSVEAASWDRRVGWWLSESCVERLMIRLADGSGARRDQPR